MSHGRYILGPGGFEALVELHLGVEMGGISSGFFSGDWGVDKVFVFCGEGVLRPAPLVFWFSLFDWLSWTLVCVLDGNEKESLWPSQFTSPVVAAVETDSSISETAA